MTLSLAVSGLGVVAAILAAWFWLRAALVSVPDNIDTFIAALQRASRFNAYGAWCAVVGALCAALLFAQEAVTHL